VWSRMKPIYFQEFVSDPERRREAWRRAFTGVARWTGASPNEGHYAVARLVASGKGAAVITQNVDNLHQDSGIPEEKGHRAARQRQLCKVPVMRPAARAGRAQTRVRGSR